MSGSIVTKFANPLTKAKILACFIFSSFISLLAHSYFFFLDFSVVRNPEDRMVGHIYTYVHTYRLREEATQQTEVKSYENKNISVVACTSQSSRSFFLMFEHILCYSIFE